jgi:hypothetical protein
MQKQLTRDEILEIAARIIKCDKKCIRVQPRYVEYDGSKKVNDDQGDWIRIPRKTNTIYFCDKLQVAFTNAQISIGSQLFNKVLNFEIANLVSPTTNPYKPCFETIDLQFCPEITIGAASFDTSGVGTYAIRFYYLEIYLV